VRRVLEIAYTAHRPVTKESFVGIWNAVWCSEFSELSVFWVWVFFLQGKERFAFGVLRFCV